MTNALTPAAPPTRIPATTTITALATNPLPTPHGESNGASRALRPWGLIATLAMVSSLALPAAAAASSVGNDGAVVYTAAPGERNDVRIGRVSGGYVLTDLGARITPGRGCASMGAHTVGCADLANGGIRIFAGDRDDRVRAHRGASVSAGGGPGNDVLVGAAGPDVLYGGDGNDRLSGGAGDDGLWPGAGFDLISCGSGREEVGNTGSGDLVEPSCERLARLLGDGELDASWRPYPFSVSRRRAVFEVACLQDDFPYPCAGSLSVREVGGRRRLLGRARFSVRAVAARRVAVPLTAIGRRLASRRGRLIAAVSVTGRNTAATGWRIRWGVSRR